MVPLAALSPRDDRCCLPTIIAAFLSSPRLTGSPQDTDPLHERGRSGALLRPCGVHSLGPFASRTRCLSRAAGAVLVPPADLARGAGSRGAVQGGERAISLRPRHRGLALRGPAVADLLARFPFRSGPVQGGGRPAAGSHHHPGAGAGARRALFRASAAGRRGRCRRCARRTCRCRRSGGAGFRRLGSSLVLDGAGLRSAAQQQVLFPYVVFSLLVLPSNQPSATRSRPRSAGRSGYRRRLPPRPQWRRSRRRFSRSSRAPKSRSRRTFRRPRSRLPLRPLVSSRTPPSVSFTASGELPVNSLPQASATAADDVRLLRREHALRSQSRQHEHLDRFEAPLYRPACPKLGEIFNLVSLFCRNVSLTQKQQQQQPMHASPVPSVIPEPQPVSDSSTAIESHASLPPDELVVPPAEQPVSLPDDASDATISPPPPLSSMEAPSEQPTAVSEEEEAAAPVAVAANPNTGTIVVPKRRKPGAVAAPAPGASNSTPSSTGKQPDTSTWAKILNPGSWW